MLSEAKFIVINITDHASSYKETTSMDIAAPCILILGGENTNSSDVAQTYFRSIKDTLESNNITTGLNLYSAYYNFGAGTTCRDSAMDRLCLFYDFRDPKRLAEMSGISQNTIAGLYHLYGTEPQYIDSIYKFALQPRLYTKDGRLFSPAQIAQNLRNMVIFAHCHGAYIIRMLEQKILADPKIQSQLSKTPKLLQNLVVISHAPFAPLENCQFTTLSFCSASDRQANIYTELDYRLKAEPAECKLAFLGPEFGNIVIGGRLKHNIHEEHSHIGLRGSNFTNKKLTSTGKKLFAIERNALIQSVTAMIKGKPIPTIHQMLHTPDTNYKDLKRQGMQLYRHFMHTR